MRGDVFGSGESFLYGATCTTESVVPFPKKEKSFRMIEISKGDLKAQSAPSWFPVIDKIPTQSATPEQVLERNIRWNKVLPLLRKYWDCSQEELSDILGMGSKTVLNIEKRSTSPNTINQEKLFSFKEITEFLNKEVGSRQYAFLDVVNSELPALGMKSPKEFLKSEKGLNLKELLGVFKRMYR
ncbi:hypothetical protein HN630_00080 [archaeon]|jgi:DNA-binding XRE family transcriptional regulator|nr:hypothetical protein [archaeon]